MAILLNLQLKGYIKIENNKVSILKDIKRLLPHEKLILEKIEYGKYDEKFFEKIFKRQLKEDMILKGYIRKQGKDKTNITYCMEIITAWMMLFLLSMIFILGIAGDSNEETHTLLWIYLSCILSIPIYKFIQSKINVVTRTEKTIELSAKMKGIKNYIVDYSNIKDNNADMIVLYEEFVIYAIILDMKGDLDRNSKQLYENTKNMVVNLY